MIAKINLDGKEHFAIVLDESFSYEDVTRFRKALNSYMQTTEAHLASRGCDYTNHDDNYYLHTLMSEMEFTDDQMFDMIRSYFAHDSDSKEITAKKKLCEIYI
ncbi:MAG: hypothetical protein SOZ80_00450 [Prevotella sp.]|uniref:hypothetical protein n=1 Tax=Prevotella sp. TaxID=59823 RepID=UPI002A30A4DE|nr:hypothetical protein [Prevotella sp.]MDD7318863.1 hypothetical protein [Prevotellaceae bacterium]MDY4019241.1 hypothetical protein [Prevotella sp.]